MPQNSKNMRNSIGTIVVATLFIGCAVWAIVMFVVTDKNEQRRQNRSRRMPVENLQSTLPDTKDDQDPDTLPGAQMN